MSVTGMYVVCVFPDNVNGPSVDEVPRMACEMTVMMELQKARALEVKRMEAEDHRRQAPLAGGIMSGSTTEA